jgi:hypothetical protein
MSLINLPKQSYKKKFTNLVALSNTASHKLLSTHVFHRGGAGMPLGIRLTLLRLQDDKCSSTQPCILCPSAPACDLQQAADRIPCPHRVLVPHTPGIRLLSRRLRTQVTYSRRLESDSGYPLEVVRTCESSHL